MAASATCSTPSSTGWAAAWAAAAAGPDPCPGPDAEMVLRLDVPRGRVRRPAGDRPSRPRSTATPARDPGPGRAPRPPGAPSARAPGSSVGCVSRSSGRWSPRCRATAARAPASGSPPLRRLPGRGPAMRGPHAHRRRPRRGRRRARRSACRDTARPGSGAGPTGPSSSTCRVAARRRCSGATGDDLHASVHVAVTQAALGDGPPLRHPGRHPRPHRRPGDAERAVLRMKDLGVPQSRGRGRGDLLRPVRGGHPHRASTTCSGGCWWPSPGPGRGLRTCRPGDGLFSKLRSALS